MVDENTDDEKSKIMCFFNDILTDEVCLDQSFNDILAWVSKALE